MIDDYTSYCPGPVIDSLPGEELQRLISTHGGRVAIEHAYDRDRDLNRVFRTSKDSKNNKKLSELTDLSHEYNQRYELIIIWV